MKKFIILSILLLGVTLFGASAQANLITNGSFEILPDPLASGTWTIYKSIPGWIGTDEIEVRNNVAGTAQDGVIFVELDANRNSLMYQDVATVSGMAYSLSYYYAPRVNILPESNGIELFFNGTKVDEITGDGTVNSDWILRSVTVIGTGSDTVKFVAIGTSDSYGGSLDNVSMTAVPEPATMLLVGAGLLGLSGLRRRFKK